MKDEDYEYLMDHSDGRPHADHGMWGFMEALRWILGAAIVIVCVLVCLGL